MSIRVASDPSVMRAATTCQSSAMPARATAGAPTKMAPGLRALPLGKNWTAPVGHQGGEGKELAAFVDAVTHFACV